MTGTDLVGRDHELGRLHDLVDRATERGGALVVRGEAGIGKSALLAAARHRARARGMLVLATTGVQAETHLPFAGLHLLLRPIWSGVDALPAPQRAAVLAAFGLTDTAAPDPYLIALATLNLLAETAAQTPLLLTADDAQWADRPSCEVLTFVARRLEFEPIVMLFAVRDGFDGPLDQIDLPELRLERLDEAAADALLDASAPGLATVVRERLLEQAAGNPLALTELPAALAIEHRGGHVPLPAWLPLSTRLERSFAVRLSELAADTHALLHVAAVDDGDQLAEILGAATLVPGTNPSIEALQPAVAAGLVEVNTGDLRFHHPLVRSAVYQAMSLPQRHTAHAALARVLTAEPDRRAWHLAAATVGTDEAVATELDAVAARAQRRGAPVVAAEAYEHAARLSADPAQRVSRLLRAAELAAELGRLDMVARLTREVEPLALTILDQGRLARIREIVEPGAMGDPARIRALIETAEQVKAAGDTGLALTLLMMAAARTTWGGEDEETRGHILATAGRVSEPDREPWVLAILAMAAPLERSAVVLERLARWRPDGADAEALRMLGVAAWEIGDYDGARAFFAAATAGLRREGRLGLMARALTLQALGDVQLGNWNAALATADEGERLAREIGHQITLGRAVVAKAMVAGLRGEDAGAEALIEETERIARPIRDSWVLELAQQARGLMSLGSGRYAEAYISLRSCIGAAQPDRTHGRTISLAGAVGYLAEAAVRSGHRDEARVVLEQLEPVAARSPSPGLQVGMRHARALLADDEDGEALYQAALRPELARWPFAHARLQLAYGAWLRRHRRIAESRAPVRAARQTFDALGAALWSEQARQELRAAGEASPRRVPNALDLLTPQELQIARIAAGGLSNREIGQQLFLSHRTVGSHLYRIFPKLGITQRSELRTAVQVGAPLSE